MSDLVNWRYERSPARPRVMITMAVGSAIVAAMYILFMLAPDVKSRYQNFSATFANTPYLAEFLALYYGAYAIGICTVIYRCWRGAREMPNDKVWLRRGIQLTAIGMSFPAAYATLSLAAVVAAWFGKNISYLSVTVAPRIAALGVPEFLIAISIVSWGPRLPSARQWVGDWWSAARDYLKLRPLWRALRDVDPNMVHSPRTLSERFTSRFGSSGE